MSAKRQKISHQPERQSAHIARDQSPSSESATLDEASGQNPNETATKTFKDLVS